jgi:LacI family transcriptional regulator
LRGIAIPDALAVCGVDDSQIARFSVPSITSVNVNAPEITRTAAEMLLAMLDGVEVGPRRHLVQPAGVVVRESTGVLHHDEPTVASALRFMLAHIEEDISAEDVAAGAGVSRSTLDRLFRRERLPAPMTQLRRFRLERARSLLVSTDLPLADVAVRSGFAYLSHFSRTFKAAEGRTPSDYRRANQFATAGPQPF